NLAARLRDILDIHGDSRALAAYLRADATQLPARLDPAVKERARRTLHRDPALAAWSGLAAALGTLVCAAIWLATGWKDGPTALVHGAIALLAGLAIAIVVTRSVRSMNAERAARRIARLAWRDLAEVAAASSPPDREPLVGRMLDRLSLLTPRVAEARADVAS